MAGVRHGKGIAVIRDDNGIWRPPTFLSMTGGSVGWQVGVQSTDVVLVFNTRKSVNGSVERQIHAGRGRGSRRGSRRPRRLPPPRMCGCRRRCSPIRAVAGCLRAHRSMDRWCSSTRPRTKRTTTRRACGPTGRPPHPMRSFRRPRRDCWRRWPRMRPRAEQIWLTRSADVPPRTRGRRSAQPTAQRDSPRGVPARSTAQ